MKMNHVCWVVLIIAGSSLFGVAAGSNPPAPKKPVTNEYHGVKVEDDYQWLENDNDPEVKAWSDAQNRKARAYLDKLPDRPKIETQLTEWYAKTSPSYSDRRGFSDFEH